MDVNVRVFLNEKQDNLCGHKSTLKVIFTVYFLSVGSCRSAGCFSIAKTEPFKDIQVVRRGVLRNANFPSDKEKHVKYE